MNVSMASLGLFFNNALHGIRVLFPVDLQAIQAPLPGRRGLAVDRPNDSVRRRFHALSDRVRGVTMAPPDHVSRLIFFTANRPVQAALCLCGPRPTFQRLETHVRTNIPLTIRTGFVTTALLAAAMPGLAAEGGTSIYPHGTEGYMVGALPPPGVYGMWYGRQYSADRVNDDQGNGLNIPGFKVRANAMAARVAWVPGIKVLGGDLVTHVIVPWVKPGLGDITTGVGIGFHHNPQWHSVVAVDVFMPTGRHTPGDLANIGKNHWAFEPVYALSRIDPKGFNADIKLGYTINARNKDSGYTSGDEFHFDYATGWGLGNGWTVGVGGYVYQQVSADKSAGMAVPAHKGRAISVGPNIKYDSGKGWFVTMKLEKEMAVKNRAQGHTLWLKAAFPL
jgi:hypothetical protein